MIWLSKAGNSVFWSRCCWTTKIIRKCLIRIGFTKRNFSQEVKIKMRDKIKFEKPEEISLEEIQVEHNGEFNKVKCVLLMVI